MGIGKTPLETSTRTHKINPLNPARSHKVTKTPKATPKTMITSTEEVSPADGQSPGTSTILEFAELEKSQSKTVEPRKCSNASDMSVGATSWGNEMYCFSPLFLLNKHLPVVSIGQYALFQTVPNGKQYPARIISTDGSQVNLAWHVGNSYSPGDTPTAPGFSCPVQEVMDALEYAALNAAGKLQASSQH
jgi:hypothetical protein